MKTYADVVKVLNDAGCVSSLACISDRCCTMVPAGHKDFMAGLSMAVRMSEALDAAGFTRLPTLMTLGVRVRL